MLRLFSGSSAHLPALPRADMTCNHIVVIIPCRLVTVNKTFHTFLKNILQIVILTTLILASLRCLQLVFLSWFDKCSYYMGYKSCFKQSHPLITDATVNWPDVVFHTAKFDSEDRLCHDES